MKNKEIKIIKLETPVNNTQNNGRYSTLICGVDKSCEIEVGKITPYPAIPEEFGALCRGFGGYRIELAPFKGMFTAICFRGCGNGKNVVCGYVIDKHGYIESVATEANEDGYVTLPLTPDSHALFATVPKKGGKPVWSRVTVQFIRHHHLRPLNNETYC